jgi:anti-anti-sigma factor
MSAAGAEPGMFGQAHDVSGRPVLRLTGDLDLANGHAVAEQLARLVDGAPHGVAVDLSSVAFIDSTGLHVLLAARREYGDRVRVVATNRVVDRLLDITGTGPYLLDGDSPP